MSSYYRGWKNTYSPHPRPPSRGIFAAIWKILAYLLGLLWVAIRWIFRRKGFWRKIVALGAASALVLFIFSGILFAYYAITLPGPDKLARRDVPESTRILDRNGKLLYEIHGEIKRDVVELGEVPQHMKEAIIAIEDKDFYRHKGISFTGIIRSALKNLFTDSRVGGSTITQQFVRNAVLTREKTYTRKVKEIIISLQLERRYSKDEILKLYINEIPFGSNAYGVQAAAQTFFGKDARDLTLAESAYLAALPQAPTFYSPYGPHRAELDQRADTVLALMADQGYITKEQKNSAQAAAVAFRDIGTGNTAIHFVLYIQDLLAQKYGEITVREGGLKVTTALDLDLQKIAEEAVARQVAINEKNYRAGNASLVAIDPKTGQILAMVGSRDYFDKEHDGAVNVSLRPRQPGSSFKPYVYATAFKEGLNPAAMLFDVVTNFGEFGGKEYIPQDYDGGQRGPVSIRKALQGSLNIPAVKTLILVGIEDAIDTAEQMGITTLKDRSRYGPSLVLGGGEVKLLDHVSAFGVFAAGGIRHEPVSILKVEDKNGKELEAWKESRGREVLDPQIAYQINNVLSDNDSRIYIFGAGNRLQIPGRTVAAKTGTTQEYRDAWTVGYTPSLAAGVWIGNNDNSQMSGKADGSVVAAPIWNEFMRRALANKPNEDFPRPDGIIEMAVDAVSGKLPTTETPITKTEIFASFNVPKELDNVHKNGCLVYHSEKPDDPAWENPVRAWALANGGCYPGEAGGPPTADLEINIAAPKKIAALPWEISAEINTPLVIKEVQFLLDGAILATVADAPYTLTSSVGRAPGQHTLTVSVETTDGQAAQNSTGIEFALQENLWLITPPDNSIVNLPTNIVLEANRDVGLADVAFKIRAGSGQESVLPGMITRRQISSKLYHYTLNWGSDNRPESGSYALFAEISGESSNQVVIKIE